MERNWDITRLLVDAQSGDKNALDSLYLQVYEQLKEIARKHLAYERNAQTLQKTALVHELYLKMLGNAEIEWQNRAHFYSIASRCMRQILVDYARKKVALRRGGKMQPVTLDEEKLDLEEHSEEIIHMHDLITKLSEMDLRKGRVVEMRFFGGMSIPEISEALGVTTRTVDRDWAKAKLWLYNELKAS